MTKTSSFKHPSNIKTVVIPKSSLTRKRKRKFPKKDLKREEKKFDSLVQKEILGNIKKIGRYTRKKPIHLKYNSIIKLNKKNTQPTIVPPIEKTKDTSYTYPRGILKGTNNFVPRRVVSTNIKTAKRKKKFNMLTEEDYEKKSKQGNTIVSTITPIINSKKLNKKRRRRKTAKTKRYTLKLNETTSNKNQKGGTPAKDLNVTPILSKSFNADGIKKFMDAITYDGVMEMVIKKEE